VTIAAIAAVLVLQMFVAMVLSSWSEGVTFDEPAHLAAGVGYTQDHDLTWNAEHPPLIKILAALPLRLAGTHVPRDSVEYHTGQQYGWGQQILFQSGNDAKRTVLLAHLPLILLTCLFGLVVFGFATDLVGAEGGLVSLAMFSVMPDILGHGPLVTTDVGVSGFLVLTLWMLWRARHRHTAWLAAAGVAYGLACATKFTALVDAPAVAPLVLFAAWPRREGRVERSGRAALQAAARSGVAAVLALAVVWTIYLGVDLRLRYRLPVPVLAADAQGTLPKVADHLPFPRPYRIGLRYVIGGEQVDRIAFLRGETYNGGRKSFYPLVLSMKIPIGSMVVAALGLATVFLRRRRDVMIHVLAPGAFIFGSAVFSNINIGVRHAMPVVLLLVVVAGVVAIAPRQRLVRPVVAAGLAAAALSSWIAFPRYLSYINEAWGGPGRGYELVADSNIDWGQGLPYLAHYLRQSGADPQQVSIVYFGQGSLTAYGVGGKDASAEQDFTGTHDLVVVSVTLYDFDRGRFAELGRPDAVVADTFLVFDKRRS
jgi:hypothetical protein